MANRIDTDVSTSATLSNPAEQAFRVLHVAFVIAPTLAGLDKFFDLLCNWDKYLAPQIARFSPIGTHGLMMVVGAIEIVAGLIVALKPKIGGYIVMLWLWGIVVNLLIAHSYYDIALRDFGLSLGALALARLATAAARERIVLPIEATGEAT